MYNMDENVSEIDIGCSVNKFPDSYLNVEEKSTEIETLAGFGI